MIFSDMTTHQLLELSANKHYKHRLKLTEFLLKQANLFDLHEKPTPVWLDDALDNMADSIDALNSTLLEKRKGI